MGFAGPLFDKGNFSADKLQNLKSRTGTPRTGPTGPTERRGTGPTGGTGRTRRSNPLPSGRGGRGGGATVLRYPEKRLDSSSDYLQIKVVKYTPNSNLMSKSDKASQKQGGPASGHVAGIQGKSLTAKVGRAVNMETASSRARKQSPLSMIFLPIPQGVTDNNSVSYKSDDLNPVKAAMAQFAMGMMTQPGETLKKAVDIDSFGKIDETTKQAILAKLTGSAVGAESMVTRATGQVMNPNLETIFSGVSIRDFSFTFALAPRNQSEGQQVKQIIRTFKKHSAAKGVSGNGFFIGSPDIFICEYMKGGAPHPFLNVFKPAVLSSMNVNYTGQGTYSTFYDGTPTSMTLTLNFQELNPIYSEQYDEGVGLQGVGF